VDLARRLCFDGRGRGEQTKSQSGDEL